MSISMRQASDAVRSRPGEPFVGAQEIPRDDDGQQAQEEDGAPVECLCGWVGVFREREEREGED